MLLLAILASLGGLFTHPFLNLILCLFHSSSHAVFTKIPPPPREARDLGSLGLLGKFPQPCSRQAQNHCVAVNTHCRSEGPNFHLGGHRPCQGQESHQVRSEEN